MKTVTTDFVRKFIDFAPSLAKSGKGFAESQLEGTTAVFNMLARNRCAYLADEVGTGKTYVALGVMSLLRYFNPRARIIVITPRENIQRKWIKEMENFIHFNWKSIGNRVKSLQGRPTWEPVYCNSLLDFTHEVLLNSNRDFFLRMPSFSLRLGDNESQKRFRTELLKMLPWIDGRFLVAPDRIRFADAFGCVMNAALPNVDLVVVDEAHKLKHGFGPRASMRNRIMGLLFGHSYGKHMEAPWYEQKAKHVLFLSATPFEEEYGAIHRQFDVFNFGNSTIRSFNGGKGSKIKELSEPEISESNKQDILKQLMVRRVSCLLINGQKYTKNMYRREWRNGGFDVYDDPIMINDPKQRLVVALMQKKVAEVLQDERFNNQFQIGMLSSFESFLQSVKTTAKRKSLTEKGEDDTSSSFFGDDQNQVASSAERNGIDTSTINHIVDSYHNDFGEKLPHPKLDATATALNNSFETGEKTLVFVRRVATVDELAFKLDRFFDSWIRIRMKKDLPELNDEIETIFHTYNQERRGLGVYDQMEPLDGGAIDDIEDEFEERRFLDREDEGSTESFFSWFFRGTGPKGILSGTAFQKNRLSSTSAIYSTLFEDDHVSWLLGRPSNVLLRLSKITEIKRKKLIKLLREKAFSHFSQFSHQKTGYPKLYVFESYQAAALDILRNLGGDIGERASIVLVERYPEGASVQVSPPKGFPGPNEALGLTSFFTELVKDSELREKIWPDEYHEDFRYRFRRREQRRELISAASRLGASFIDLYLLAMKSIGSFKLGRQSDGSKADKNLAKNFVKLLKKQQNSNEFNAYYELSNIALAFDVILSVNFPTVHTEPIDKLATIYGATLQRQTPVGRMSGGVNNRLVRQFRMPGFPLVLVTTDVLQEGEDLHTFCRKVIHYGVAWTPSALEQRVGRVDRISGLFQRKYDGSHQVPTDDEYIQVYYPHLRDTVEVLQIRRVLKRLNRFLQLIHKTTHKMEDLDNRINSAEEMLDEIMYIPQVEGPLESAFPVDKQLLQGDLSVSDAKITDYSKEYSGYFNDLWQQLLNSKLIKDVCGIKNPRIKEGIAHLVGDKKSPCSEERGDICIDQHFHLEIKSQVSGDATLMRCLSEVGYLNLRKNDVIDELYDMQIELGQIKLCVMPDSKKHLDFVTIEGDILFHPQTTQIEEVMSLVKRTTEAAYKIENAFRESLFQK